MKKSALIVDVTSLNKNGVLVAHMPNVAWNYYQVLSKKYDAKIAGGQPYENKFGSENVYLLPFHADRSISRGRIKTKIEEIINAIVAFRSNSNILVFQCYSRLFPILFATILFKKKYQKVFLIQYFIESNEGKAGKYIEKIMLKFCRQKVNGILCPSEAVSKRFPFPHLIVPDYFYLKENFPDDIANSLEYDFGMFGIMGPDKDVESVIDAFKTEKGKVIIAGKFADEKRYEACALDCPENITIINRFLEIEEYNRLFNASKVVLMPYSNGYNNHSSGVVLDALFHKKPIVGTRVAALKFVEELHLGRLYVNSEEMKNAIKCVASEYSQYVGEINKYLESHNRMMLEMFEFFERI